VRAVLVVVHGYGEHGGRYEEMADALRGQGIGVAVPDLHGHGRSDGRRGDVRDVRWCTERLRALTEAVILPAFHRRDYAVFGHSFGGLVSAHWALAAAEGLRRIVLQSPLLAVGFRVPWWKAVAAGWLGRFCPTCALPMDLDAAALSHDPAVVDAYRRDPLVHNRMTARGYRSLVAAAADANRMASQCRIPVLVLYGTADRIVSVTAARRWFETVRCEKRCVAFADAYHELHHEPIRADALRAMCEWVLPP